MISTGEKTDWALFWLSENERKEAPRAIDRERGGRESKLSECCLWFASRTRDGSRSNGSASIIFLFTLFIPGSARIVSPSFNHRLSDGPASQRPELHQSRGFVLRGRPDWALHEPVHPLHHRYTLRALPAPWGDRGRTEEEAVAKT